MTSPETQAKVLVVTPHPDRTPGGVATFVKAIMEKKPAWDLQTSQAETGKTSTILGQIIQLLVFVWVVRRFDVIYLQASEYRSIIRKSIYALFARILGRQTVVHLHAANIPLPGTLKFKTTFFLIKALDLPVICLSEHWKAVLQTGGLRNVYVIPNPVVDPTLFELEKDVTTDSTLHIVFLGRVGVRKGVDILIKALNSTTIANADIEVVIAGDGEIEVFKDKLGADQRNVQFLGWINYKKKYEILSWADVVCLPSRAEGMPLALIEGAASGNMLLSSDIPAIISAFHEFGPGCVFFESGNSASLENGLNSILSLGKNQIKNLGAENRKLAKKLLSFEAFFDKLNMVLFQ